MLRTTIIAGGLLGLGIFTAAPAMAAPPSTVSCSPPAICPIITTWVNGVATAAGVLATGPATAAGVLANGTATGAPVWANGPATAAKVWHDGLVGPAPAPAPGP
jgi:hypothetical protein